MLGASLIQKQKLKVQDLQVIQHMIELLGITMEPTDFVAQITQGESKYKVYRMQTLMTLAQPGKMGALSITQPIQGSCMYTR